MIGREPCSDGRYAGWGRLADPCSMSVVGASGIGACPAAH